jgi:hypothetical protein
LFVGGLMSYLRYLCLFAYSGVCFWFCLSSSCILCNLCYQFIWFRYEKNRLCSDGQQSSNFKKANNHIPHQIIEYKEFHGTWRVCVFGFVCLRPVSCVTYVTNFSRLSNCLFPLRWVLTFIFCIGDRDHIINRGVVIPLNGRISLQNRLFCLCRLPAVVVLQEIWFRYEKNRLCSDGQQSSNLTVGSAKKFVMITSDFGGGEFTKTLRKVCTSQKLKFAFLLLEYCKIRECYVYIDFNLLLTNRNLSSITFRLPRWKNIENLTCLFVKNNL